MKFLQVAHFAGTIRPGVSGYNVVRGTRCQHLLRLLTVPVFCVCPEQCSEGGLASRCLSQSTSILLATSLQSFTILMIRQSLSICCSRQSLQTSQLPSSMSC